MLPHFCLRHPVRLPIFFLVRIHFLMEPTEILPPRLLSQFMTLSSEFQADALTILTSVREHFDGLDVVEHGDRDGEYVSFHWLAKDVYCDIRPGLSSKYRVERLYRRGDRFSSSPRYTNDAIATIKTLVYLLGPIHAAK
jgi:hypothetical protein